MSGTIVTRYLDPKSPAPKCFFRHKQKDSKKEWQECKLRIVKVGGIIYRTRWILVSRIVFGALTWILPQKTWETSTSWK